MASVSLSCRLAGFSARLSLLLALSFVPPPSLSLSLSLSLWFPFPSPSRPPPSPPRRALLTKGPGRYLEENSLSSLATREIPTCTSIAGEQAWHVRGNEEDVGWKLGRSKSAQRGWKRNCFVSESAVCVLA